MTTTTTDLNRKSAGQLGWLPGWFGLPDDEWGEPLCNAIKAFQDGEESILVDGWCDHVTFRRILTDRQLDGLEPQPPHWTQTQFNADTIVMAGKEYSVPWDRVVTMGEPGALELPQSKRSKARFSEDTPPNLVVVHWPVTNDIATSRRVLAAKNLAVAFGIDWDGTIYQHRDLAYSGVHAGGKSTVVSGINANSWGIDVANPVKLERNPKLERLGQPARPVINAEGPYWRKGSWKPAPFLGFHEVQIDALAALAAALNVHFGFPLEAPARRDPRRLDVVSRKEGREMRGWVHHAEVTNGKWDSLSIDLADVLTRAEGIVAAGW